MPISFNKEDYNISKIKFESRLSNLKTKLNYRVYGLKEGRMLEIDYPVSFWKGSFANAIRYLEDFQVRNKFTVSWNDYDDSNIKLEEKFVKIGIHKNLRENIPMSVSILQTFIYGFEGRINWENHKKYVIGGLPEIKTDI